MITFLLHLFVRTITDCHINMLKPYHVRGETVSCLRPAGQVKAIVALSSAEPPSEVTASLSGAEAGDDIEGPLEKFGGIEPK